MVLSGGGERGYVLYSAINKHHANILHKKGLNTARWLSVFKRDTFCDFSVCFPVHQSQSDKKSTLKGNICSQEEQII